MPARDSLLRRQDKSTRPMPHRTLAEVAADWNALAAFREEDRREEARALSDLTLMRKVAQEAL